MITKNSSCNPFRLKKVAQTMNWERVLSNFESVCKGCRKCTASHMHALMRFPLLLKSLSSLVPRPSRLGNLQFQSILQYLLSPDSHSLHYLTMHGPYIHTCEELQGRKSQEGGAHDQQDCSTKEYILHSYQDMPLSAMCPE